MIDSVVLTVAVLAILFLLSREKLKRAEWNRTQKPKYKVAIARMLSSSTAPRTGFEINELLEQWTLLDTISDQRIHELLEEMLEEGTITRKSVEPDKYCLVRAA